MVYFEPAYRYGLPLSIGHRGGGGSHLPENTIAAFSAGEAAGATVLETDVRLTRDERVVTIHDPDLRRLAESNRTVTSCSHRELAAIPLLDACGTIHENLGVPLLSDVLEHFPDSAFNLDIKSDNPILLDKTLAVIRRADAVSRVCLATFSPRVMRRIRRLAPDTVVSMHPGEVRRFLVAPMLVGSRATALQIPRRHGPIPIVTERLIRRAHARRLEVHVWTINDPVEAAYLSALGADGIITDDVAVLANIPRRRAAQWTEPT